MKCTINLTHAAVDISDACVVAAKRRIEALDLSPGTKGALLRATNQGDLQLPHKIEITTALLNHQKQVANPAPVSTAKLKQQVAEQKNTVCPPEASAGDKQVNAVLEAVPQTVVPEAAPRSAQFVQQTRDGVTVLVQANKYDADYIREKEQEHSAQAKGSGRRSLNVNQQEIGGTLYKSWLEKDDPDATKLIAEMEWLNSPERKERRGEYWGLVNEDKSACDIDVDGWAALAVVVLTSSFCKNENIKNRAAKKMDDKYGSGKW